MVVIELQGGLGNQLFQYATARALSIERNDRLMIDKKAYENYKLHAYGLHHFNLVERFYKEDHMYVRKIKNVFQSRLDYEEDTFHYNPEVFNFKEDKLVLKGYFQSEKYFSKYREILLNELDIVTDFTEKTKDMLNCIDKVNAVSIHIRRGDFLKHDVHNTDKSDYYKKAMQCIEDKVKDPVYFVFSDDMHWVKANFKTNHVTHYVDFNDASTNYEDLKLMSACKNNIIANSSFSWWGAWLNRNEGKIVVAPEQWFNGDVFDYSDVIPETWIKI